MENGINEHIEYCIDFHSPHIAMASLGDIIIMHNIYLSLYPYRSIIYISLVTEDDDDDDSALTQLFVCSLTTLLIVRDLLDTYVCWGWWNDAPSF